MRETLPGVNDVYAFTISMVCGVRVFFFQHFNLSFHLLCVLTVVTSFSLISGSTKKPQSQKASKL